MEPSHNETEEYNPLDLYDPDEVKTPPALLWAALVHCYSVAVLGTIGKRLNPMLNEAMQQFSLGYGQYARRI